MQSFGGPFHSWNWPNKRLKQKEVCTCYLFIEQECTLVRSPMYVIGSSLLEIVETENTRIANSNDVDRGSDCEVRWAGKIIR